MATITIHTEYRRYNPPEWVDPTVRRLLDSVSVQLTDLGAIVLTERIVATTRKGSRVMRRNKRGTPLGVYHPAWNGQPAWIEIVVDDIVAELSDWPLANWSDSMCVVTIGTCGHLSPFLPCSPGSRAS